ncbi:unnamed protein product [Calicophoron daubneyi]|uniref:C2H2-type domain-containing protein n=1 Tax=Calicophoron daubneyi TaxID=300641 RepID=A0AAV2U0L3_CALDB
MGDSTYEPSIEVPMLVPQVPVVKGKAFRKIHWIRFASELESKENFERTRPAANQNKIVRSIKKTTDSDNEREDPPGPLVLKGLEKNVELGAVCLQDVLRNSALDLNSEDKNFCNFCGKAFRLKIGLKKHLATKHRDQKGKRCLVCGKVFKLVIGLRKHMATAHRTNNSCRCKLCGHLFPKKSSLKRHMEVVHRDEESYPCRVCGRVFTRKCNMYTHVATVHEGVRSYICDICGRAFTQGGNLKVHIAAVHEGYKTEPCEICGRTFAADCRLRKHLENAHRGEFSMRSPDYQSDERNYSLLSSATSMRPHTLDLHSTQ